MNVSSPDRLAPDPCQMLTEADDPALARPAFAGHLASLYASRLRAIADAKTVEAKTLPPGASKAAKAAAKQARKDAADARNAADGAERAIARENAAEHFVPAVQRQDIAGPGPDGETVILRAAMWDQDRQGRIRRSSMLATLSKRSPSITAAHVAAGDVYERVHQAAGAGVFRSCLEERIGSGVPGSGNAAIENGAGIDDAMQALRHAVGLFGCTILDHVILRNADVASWAAQKIDPWTERPMVPAVAMGILIAVLERLVELVQTDRKFAALIALDRFLEKFA